MAQKNIHRKIPIQPTAKHMTKSKNVKKVVDSNDKLLYNNHIMIVEPMVPKELPRNDSINPIEQKTKYRNPHLLQGEFIQSKEIIKRNNSKFLINFIPWHFLFCWFIFTV